PAFAKLKDINLKKQATRYFLNLCNLTAALGRMPAAETCRLRAPSHASTTANYRCSTVFIHTRKYCACSGPRLRCPAGNGRLLPSHTDRAAAATVELIRDLALGSIHQRHGGADGNSNGNLNDRVDSLASELRAATGDGVRASARELGSAIWALGKISTPSCCTHALPLLRALTAPTTLREASNQSVCNALYGTALLCRSLSGSACARVNASTSAGLQQAALALAAACLPRLDTFNEQDLGSTWWSLATLNSATFPSTSPVGCPAPHTSAPSPSSPASPFLPSPERRAVPPKEAVILPAGLLPGLSAATTRLMVAGCTTAATPAARSAAAKRAATGKAAPSKGTKRGSGNAAKAEGSAAGFSARAASTALWGAVRLGYHDAAMVDAAVQLLKPQVHDLARTDPRAFSTCLWALAALQQHHQQQPQHQQLQGSSAKGVAGLLAAAATPAASRIRCFDDQALSSLLWAYGKMGVAQRRLFAAAAEEVARRAPSMGLQSLSGCVWSFAALGLSAPHMLAAVGAALTAE
ncbi:hypothetical protein Agub_g14321, partial [Astrephomene gubernaculifera]